MTSGDEQTEHEESARGMLSTDAWMSVDQVAVLLGLSRDTVGKLVRSGELKAADLSPNFQKLGHRPLWRVNRAELAKFIQSRVPSPRPRIRKLRQKRGDVLNFLD